MRRRRQTVTQLRRQRREGRSCGTCRSCDRSEECGWVQGMLLGSQKPDRWGFRLRAVIAADQKPSVVIQEVRSIIDWDKVGVEVPGVLVDVVKALAPKTLVLLAKENGDVPILGWTKDRNGVPLGPVMPVWGPVERVREWKEALMGLWEEEGVVIP